MEKLVFKRVFDHVSPHITTNQSGFLPHHSTITQLLEIYHILLEALDKRKEIVICFLDISKAFDRVSHRALINKLRKFNIDGDLLEWFINYLSNRKQRVTIDGVSSDWKDVLAGVPQGSILGPLLFLIFINDVTENINSIIRLFADDTSLLLPSIDLSTDLDVLQRDLDKIHQWAQKWAVNFNSDKTKTLLISRRSSPTVVNLTFDNTALQLSTEHKHLGVIFNEFATWNNHLEETINKANKRLGILRNLKYSLKRNTLKVLYTTYIRSVLEYADTVWDNIPQNLSNRIEQINKNAIRCITGLTISTTSKNLYKESGLLPLNKRRKFHRLVQMFKIINGLSPNYLQQLLPQTRLDRNPYVVRGGNLFTNFLCRTETFRNSYLPSTVRDWNLLPEDLKNSASVASFKYKLKQTNEFRHTTPPIWYSYGTRHSNIYLTRMRNNCSALANDLFINHVVINPICGNCNLNRAEDAEHFFLECPKYDLARQDMFSVFATLDMPCTLIHILKGSTEHNAETNKVIVESAHNFIRTSNRFSNDAM